MDGVTELARHIKARDNPASYTPVFGTITSLPELKIQLGDRITVGSDDVKAVFDIYEKEYDSDGNFIRYAYLNKEVAMLPYSDNQKYLVVGVVQ
ncbi:MAG: DUF2577 domain-containing protein [Oscillospiraceae bacterium]|nr:DUF2577 domain-containing protein [Oscillospiraceae bacterium]